MDRTLGFHPKNEGSNPSSLSKIVDKSTDKVIKHLMSQNINKKIYNRVNYSLIFNSLITIDTIKFLSLASTNYRKGFKQHKLFIKQSYMLLT